MELVSRLFAKCLEVKNSSGNGIFLSLSVLGEKKLWLVEGALRLVRTTILLAISPLVTKVKVKPWMENRNHIDYHLREVAGHIEVKN